MSEAKSTLAYFGHHKCGSKMILNIVRMTSKYLGLKHAHFHSPVMWEYDGTHLTLDQVAQNLGLDFVSYISADAKYIGNKNMYRGIHVIRDPRDIVISSYFSHRNSHSVEHWPELIVLREKLRSLSKEEGILENIKFTAQLRVDGWDTNFFESLMNWDYSLPNIMEVKFENLITNPYQTFADMFNFLGLIDETDLTEIEIFKKMLLFNLQAAWPSMKISKHSRQIPVAIFFSILYANRFSKLAGGRNGGQENENSHYRKGVAADWKNHLTEKNKQYFKDNYNDLLVKLGYEKDDNW